jgi:serine/threonine protein kinase
MYALLIGKPPFEADTVENTYRKIKDNSFEFPKQIPLSIEFKNLIKSLLEPNPKYRIKISEIRNHEFLTKNVIKIPLTMPAYTISIPPQNSYLKQYISDKHLKLTIFPRKISNTSSYFGDEITEADKLNKKKDVK